MVVGIDARERTDESFFWTATVKSLFIRNLIYRFIRANYHVYIIPMSMVSWLFLLNVTCSESKPSLLDQSCLYSGLTISRRHPWYRSGYSLASPQEVRNLKKTLCELLGSQTHRPCLSSSAGSRFWSMHSSLHPT